MKLAILLLSYKIAEQINLFLNILKYQDVEFSVHMDDEYNELTNKATRCSCATE